MSFTISSVFAITFANGSVMVPLYTFMFASLNSVAKGKIKKLKYLSYKYRAVSNSLVHMW